MSYYMYMNIILRSTDVHVYVHVSRGHLDCVKVLLQLNAPLRPRTPEEDTPKELAVRYKQKEVVEVLGKEVGSGVWRKVGRCFWEGGFSKK